MNLYIHLPNSLKTIELDNSEQLLNCLYKVINEAIKAKKEGTEINGVHLAYSHDLLKSQIEPEMCRLELKRKWKNAFTKTLMDKKELFTTYKKEFENDNWKSFNNRLTYALKNGTIERKLGKFALKDFQDLKEGFNFVSLDDVPESYELGGIDWEEIYGMDDKLELDAIEWRMHKRLNLPLEQIKHCEHLEVAQACRAGILKRISFYTYAINR